MEEKICLDDILLLELSSSVKWNQNPWTESAVETEFTHLQSNPLNCWRDAEFKVG